MPDVPMAVDAIEHFAAIAHVRIDLADDLPVATDAIPLKDRRVFGPNDDRLVKVLQRETLRMPETIFGFGDILADEIVRRVTVVARGHRVVR
jgi:hypothetical protein